MQREMEVLQLKSRLAALEDYYRDVLGEEVAGESEEESAEETEADVDSAGWKEEGGDLAGVRVAGFVPTVLGLLSRAFEGVTGVRAVVEDGRAAGFVAGTAFFGGEEGGVGEATLSDVTGEVGAGSATFSSAAGVGAGSGSGAAGSGNDTGAGGSGDFVASSILGSGLGSNTLAAAGLGFGGHSRFSFSSSFAASPVCCDATLDERGGSPTADCLLFCCSKRPMRLATL